MAITLVIADDHPIVLQGLQNLFALHPDIQTVACCSTGPDALAAVEAHHPNVLLLDLKMDGFGGLDVLRQLRASGASCRTALLTAAATDEDVITALDLGASGVVLKDSTPDQVVDAVRQVARGQSWIDRDTLGRAMVTKDRTREASLAPQATVTPRELELIKLVAEGLRNREISTRLGITEGTVKIHLHHIYDKLGVDGRLELVLAAQHKRLV